MKGKNVYPSYDEVRVDDSRLQTLYPFAWAAITNITDWVV